MPFGSFPRSHGLKQCLPPSHPCFLHFYPIDPAPLGHLGFDSSSDWHAAARTCVACCLQGAAWQTGCQTRQIMDKLCLFLHQQKGEYHLFSFSSLSISQSCKNILCVCCTLFVKFVWNWAGPLMFLTERWADRQRDSMTI